jgi:hypothetical protein
MKSAKIITAIVMLTAAAGIAILSIPVYENVDAQCSSPGNPDRGAEHRKCGGPGIHTDCRTNLIINPNERFHEQTRCIQ